MSFRLFPKQEWTFHSALTVDEVLQRLRDKLEADKHRYRRSVAKYYFQGQVEGNYFTIRQITGYRGNSGAPVISGTVWRDLDGTVIQLHLEVTGCAVIFFFIWSWVPMLMLLMSVVSFFRDGEFNPTIVLGAIGAIAFMYWVITGGFRDGKKVVQAFMEETFEGKLLV